MAFDKAKVLKAAEKFLSQGKINAAIKEYRQIVDNDADDLTTLNMLGDLYVRSGKKEEAVSCFERIAEHYSAQQFNLKAIAMYKKIERIRTRDPLIAFKLAELYGSQGLVHDARAQYLVVADAYTRAGDNKKALDVLHKIADLDPNNTEIRLKLADGYVKENMRREAADAYIQAANRLHQTAAHEKALDAYSKASSLPSTAMRCGACSTRTSHAARLTKLRKCSNARSKARKKIRNSCRCWRVRISKQKIRAAPNAPRHC
jgi:tetratricopeptide (TPR) repeat protein